jgi:uncharacterized protein
MKVLLQILIRLYWLVPKQWRRRCVFKESCSAYIFRIASQEGFLKALKAFKERRHQCRPNYSLFATEDGKEWVILSDQSVVERSCTRV